MGEAGLGVGLDAEVGAPLGAAGTDSAGAQPFGDHRVAGRQPGHAGPGGSDPAGPLVPGDHRIADIGWRAPPVEQFQVGAADPGGDHPDQHLARAGPGGLDVFHRRCARFADDERSHRAPSMISDPIFRSTYGWDWEGDRSVPSRRVRAARYSATTRSVSSATEVSAVALS